MKNEIKNYKMPFGKFKDRSLEECPLKYLDWLIGQAWLKDPTKEMIEAYLADPVIKMELEKLLDE